MIELTSPEVIRPVNIVALLAIVAVLSYRHRHAQAGIDAAVASGACMLVFAMMAFATGVNYTKGVQMGPIVPYFTLALISFLVALCTPWRWRLPRRKP